MGKILWTQRALKDLDSIFKYISTDSLFYAERFIKALIKSSLKLHEFPFSGRTVPEFPNRNLREIIFQNYRIVYRISEQNKIEIISVIHSSRDFESAIDK